MEHVLALYTFFAFVVIGNKFIAFGSRPRKQFLSEISKIYNGNGCEY